MALSIPWSERGSIVVVTSDRWRCGARIWCCVHLLFNGRRSRTRTVCWICSFEAPNGIWKPSYIGAAVVPSSDGPILLMWHESIQHQLDWIHFLTEQTKKTLLSFFVTKPPYRQQSQQALRWLILWIENLSISIRKRKAGFEQLRSRPYFLISTFYE